MSDSTTVALGEILSEPPAYGANASAIPHDGTNPRYLRITDIDDAGRLLHDDVRAIPSRIAEPYLLRHDDIVIARTGNTVGKSYKHDVSNGPLAFAGYLVRFRVDPNKADSSFIFQFLHSPDYRAWIERTLRTGAQPNVNASEYKQLPIPDRTPPEQRKIASILTTVDSLIEQTEALIEKYRRVKQGMMADLLSRGVDSDGKLRPTQQQAPELYKQSELGWIPSEWDARQLQSVASVNYGISDPLNRSLRHGLRILSLPNVNVRGEFELEDVPFVDRKYVRKRDFLAHGDLLFNWRNGSRDHLGKTAYFDLLGEWTHVGFLLRIRADRQLCNQRYLFNEMTYRRAIGFFLTSKIQVNNTFNSQELKEMVIRLPKSVDEQVAISERITALENRVAVEKKYLAHLGTLKTGLMQDLLTGKVRVKVDDTEEATPNV